MAIKLLILFCSALVASAQFPQIAHFNIPATNALYAREFTNCVESSAGFVGQKRIYTNSQYFAIENVPFFPWSNSWTVSSATITNGGGALAVDIGTESDNYIYWQISEQPVVTVGFYFYSTATNSTIAAYPLEILYVAGAYRPTTTPLYVWTSASGGDYVQAHGIMKQGGSVLYGSKIYVTRGTTNWITMRNTQSNSTVAVYDPHTWTQIGSDSTITDDATAGYTTLTIQAWDSSPAMPTKTNYYDSILVTTNGVFPLLPTNGPSIGQSPSIQSIARVGTLIKR